MQYNFDEVINRAGSNCVKFDLREKVFGNSDVIPMWVADMDFKTPDFIIQALRKRLDNEILGYTMIPETFYDSVIHWNYRRHGWKINKEWLTFAPGVVPALSLLTLSFTDPGDSVIVQPPVYFPFFSVVKNHGRKIIYNPLVYKNGVYTMDFDDLEKKIRPDSKMLFLSNPHNPTGNAWAPEILRQLSEICVKRKILLISDEIHSDLILPGNKHVPTASLSDKISQNTITCMSASKTFNLAGLSTAYLVISNPDLKKHYDHTLDTIHVGAGNIFGFIAAESAYNSGEDWLNQLLVYLHGNFTFLQKFISENIPLLALVPPQATYLGWLDCRNLEMKGEQLRQFMIDNAGLGLSDGFIFGAEGEGFQRINVGCPRIVLHEALVKLKTAIDKYLANNKTFL